MRSATAFQPAWTTIPGKTLPVRLRTQASAIPKKTRIGSASTSPCARPNASPTATMASVRPYGAIRPNPTPRPMTHDLVTDILGQLDAHVVRITVTELRESTFYAQITVQQDGSEVEIDSRPSDAIALAIRAEAPIFVADRVIEESAIEFEGEEVNEEEIVSEFKRFLDHVSPDEFAVEEEDDS